ncbi:ABC transporter, partial [Streptomyces sp. WAC 06725]
MIPATGHSLCRAATDSPAHAGPAPAAPHPTPATDRPLHRTPPPH